MSTQQTTVSFYNGHKMPIVGLGTWQSPPEEVKAAVNAALEVGYRHIDTAFAYQNEDAIGETLKKWFDSGKLKREDVFIVTKLPPMGNHAESVEKYLTKSLKALQLSYVDLYLIHIPIGLQDTDAGIWPVNEKGDLLMDMKTDHVSIWKAMEAQVDAGRARSIGISNFNSKQIDRIVKAARIRPANLQVELHVYLQQKELVAFCKALDITVCAYSPVGSPGSTGFLNKNGVKELPDSLKSKPLENPVVCQIAKKHNKTPAQVLLRHIMQRGIVVIPKSTNAGRIKENFQVFDFELSKDEMSELDALDRKGRIFKYDHRKGFFEHPEFPYNEPY